MPVNFSPFVIYLLSFVSSTTPHPTKTQKKKREKRWIEKSSEEKEKRKGEQREASVTTFPPFCWRFLRENSGSEKDLPLKDYYYTEGSVGVSSFLIDERKLSFLLIRGKARVGRLFS